MTFFCQNLTHYLHNIISVKRVKPSCAFKAKIVKPTLAITSRTALLLVQTDQIVINNNYKIYIFFCLEVLTPIGQDHNVATC